MHSARSSGGRLTPKQLTEAARTAGLDFLAATEHDTVDTQAAWNRCADEDLLVIPGQEATTRTGHWLALGIRPGHAVDWQYGVEDDQIGRHLDEVHKAGGLCVVAHPHAPYPSGVFMYPFRGFDVVEVWNGLWRSDLPWSADNERALAEWDRSLAHDIDFGRWRPAMGNSDTHLEGQIGIPHTVVLAEALTTEAILAGIGAGRSWIAESTDIDVSLEVSARDRRAGIGQRLATRREPCVVRVNVRATPSATVSLHTDGGTVHRESLPEDGSGQVEWRTTAKESAFVRVEVRHPDGRMAALTNPVVFR